MIIELLIECLGSALVFGDFLIGKRPKSLVKERKKDDVWELSYD